MDLPSERVAAPMPERLSAPPHQLVINPTRSCVFHCRHCDRELNPQAPDLPILVIARALTEIRERFGTRWMTIAGGEPLLYGGLLDLVAHGKQLGHGVNIATNGFLLTAATARRLGHWGLDQFDVSIDGFEEENDRVRNPGSFRRAMESLELMRRLAPGVRLGVTSVLHRGNLSRAPEFARFILGQPGICKLNFQAFISHVAFRRNREWYERNPLWPDDVGAARATLEVLSRLAEENRGRMNPPEQFLLMRSYFTDPTRFVLPRCRAWHYTMTIEANGDVKYCGALGPFGNLNRASFGEIWDSEAHAEMFRAWPVCRKVCHQIVNCGFRVEALEGLDLASLL